MEDKVMLTPRPSAAVIINGGELCVVCAQKPGKKIVLGAGGGELGESCSRLLKKYGEINVRSGVICRNCKSRLDTLHSKSQAFLCMCQESLEKFKKATAVSQKAVTLLPAAVSNQPRVVPVLGSLVTSQGVPVSVTPNPRPARVVVREIIPFHGEPDSKQDTKHAKQESVAPLVCDCIKQELGIQVAPSTGHSDENRPSPAHTDNKGRNPAQSKTASAASNAQEEKTPIVPAKRTLEHPVTTSTSKFRTILPRSVSILPVPHSRASVPEKKTDKKKVSHLDKVIDEVIEDEDDKDCIPALSESTSTTSQAQDKTPIVPAKRKSENPVTISKPKFRLILPSSVPILPVPPSCASVPEKKTDRKKVSHLDNVIEELDYEDDKDCIPTLSDSTSTTSQAQYKTPIVPAKRKSENPVTISKPKFRPILPSSVPTLSVPPSRAIEKSEKTVTPVHHFSVAEKKLICHQANVSMESLAELLWKNEIAREVILDEMEKTLDKEAGKSGSLKYNTSYLVHKDLQGLDSFCWDELVVEFRTKFPVLYRAALAIMSPLSSRNQENTETLHPRLGLVYSVCIQARFQQLTRVQRLLSLILYDKVKDAALFEKFQRFGVSLSLARIQHILKKL